MTILILTQDNDTHADRVAAKLRARGADVVRFDPADFPATAALSVGYGPNGTDLRLTTVWHRRPRRPVADTRIGDESTRAFVEEASRVFWEAHAGRVDAILAVKIRKQPGERRRREAGSSLDAAAGGAGDDEVVVAEPRRSERWRGKANANGS